MTTETLSNVHVKTLDVTFYITQLFLRYERSVGFTENAHAATRRIVAEHLAEQRTERSDTSPGNHRTVGEIGSIQSFSILSCSFDLSISFQPSRGFNFPSLPPCIYNRRMP
jgi:hypothetical protein